MREDSKLAFEEVDDDPAPALYRVVWEIHWHNHDSIIRNWYSDREKAINDMHDAEQRGHTILLFAKYNLAGVGLEVLRIPES